MDEGTLNDLLECSVCLDRLDTSSKVLPCQHTFCRKCLHEIVQKHKELRCPECRVLVNIKVENLPPNVLLMRLLEGMKNSVPKKQHKVRSSSLTPTSVQQTTPVHQYHGTPDRKVNNKQSSQHLLPHQPYAKALYDYEPKEAGDLSFKRGDVIYLKKRIDAHWYQGECGGKQGLFPLSYVQIITPLPSHVPQCKALYDFQTDKHEEEGCLVFKEGDIINVIRRVDENWAEGKLEGRIGIFPLTFVELNNLARSLMKLSTNAQPGPSRVAPPTPTAEDSTPLIPTDHSRNVIAQQNVPQRVQPVHQALPTSDSNSTISSGSSTTTTPNVSSSNTSNSSTAPSSPASPPPRVQPALPRSLAQKPDILLSSPAPNTPQRSVPTHPDSNTSSHQHKEKRHSFTGMAPANFNKTTHRHSAEIPATDTLPQSSSAAAERSKRSSSLSNAEDVKIPAPYVALFPYKPQKPDELELRKGAIYIVTERCQDGWFKGTSNHTQKSGVFPGNYVAPVAKMKPSSGNSVDAKAAVSFTRSGKNVCSPRQNFNNLPPELPPRSLSPATANTISSSWHGQQDSASVPLGRSSSAVMSGLGATHLNLVSATAAKPADKSKERKEKGTVGLMRRLTSIKRSKSPPPCSYSMDNPVFEDSSVGIAVAHPVHVRSGSCPSQLLQIQPADHHRLFGSASQRLKHKERPSVLTHNRTAENPTGSSSSSPNIHHHRKSNSLDAGNRAKTGVQIVQEWFRCEIPYPPNSEYELELQKDDIIYVHKKRDDGWYKGTLQRTGKTGLFPASFVKPV